MLKKLEEKINYSFKDQKILQEAMTHPSIKRFAKNNSSYQRLEFLGDKVLGLVMGEYLFKHFNKENEGQISKRYAFLVCGKSLAFVAKSIELGSFIKLARNQELEGGREKQSILENTIEALIGAIFLDGGLSSAKTFITTFFAPLINEVEHEKPPQDSKSALQEVFQKHYKKLPEYKIYKNQDTFTAEIEFEGSIFQGYGTTIKDAEKDVALSILEVIKTSHSK